MMNQAAPEMKPVTNRQMLRSLYHKLMKRDKTSLYSRLFDEQSQYYQTT